MSAYDLHRDGDCWPDTCPLCNLVPDLCGGCGEANHLCTCPTLPLDQEEEA